MSHSNCLLLCYSALALFAGRSPRASAQVAIGVGIGPEPGCPLRLLRLRALRLFLPTATMVPTGLSAESFSEPVPGTTGSRGFYGHGRQPAMTRTMATEDRCLGVERKAVQPLPGKRSARWPGPCRQCRPRSEQ